MRAVLLSISLAVFFPTPSRCDELIPGVLTFDPPTFLHGGTSHRANDDIFGGVGEIGQYAGNDNDIRVGQRLIVINLREVGYTIGPGKVITYVKLDDKALGSLLQSTIHPSPSVTNITMVTNTTVGGQPALFASFQAAQASWPKKPGAFFPFEVYWVRIESNRVVEIKLVADSSEHMETLRPCLKKFKITPKNN